MMMEGTSSNTTSAIKMEIRNATKIALTIPPNIIIFSLKSLCLVPTMENKRIRASNDSLNVTEADVINSTIICVLLD